MRHAGSFAVTMLLAALPLYACAGAMETESDAGPTPTADGGTVAQPSTAAAVRTNVRDGFVAEAEWMRSYGVAALASGPDAQAAFSRLNGAEAQIVEAVAPLSGDASAAQLNDLLHARANAFADLVTSINSRAASVTTDPQAALDANAQQLAEFFVTLCPNAFPANAGTFLETANRSMAAGLQARATNDAATAVADFDAAQVSSVRFADTVGVALTSTFGSALAPATTTRTEDGLALDLHLLFGDQVFWTRAYVVDHSMNVPTQPELDRAVKATQDMGSIFSSYFGPDTGAQLQGYIHTDTTDAIAFLYALETNDQGTVDAISATWDADTDALAQFVATTAGVDLVAAQNLLRTGADRERAMMEARAKQQWDADAVSYQLVLESRTELASLLAASIVK
jgi:hypothetical protein